MDVSIIIVNYNTKALLLQCIESIYTRCNRISYEVIVVDNNSTDGSQQAIKAGFPMVFLLESVENMGFGRANNLGIEAASGKYLFFLNSDTILLNDAVGLFHDFMENYNQANDIGCIGTYLFDENFNINGAYGDFPSLRKDLAAKKRLFFNKLKIRLPERSTITSPQKNVDYVLGADMFIPRDVLNQVGYFDPAFFMFYEESDLQKRMADVNLKRIVIEGPRIIHLEGKSTKIKFAKYQMTQISSFIYFKKNRPMYEYFIYRVISFIEGIFVLANLKNGFTSKQRALIFSMNVSALKTK